MPSPNISELLLLLVVGVLYVGSLAWVYRDAEARGVSGALTTTLLVAIAWWPLSLIVWAFIRPKMAE